MPLPSARLCSLLAAASLASAGCRDTTPRAPAASPSDASSARFDLSVWTRMDPAAFGCWMERALGHRDGRWSCGSPRGSALDAADADPCGDPDAYFAGPELPAALAPRLHPLLRKVDLAWEHGALQGATFVFAPGVGPAEMERALGVDRHRLADAASAGPGSCDTDDPCYQVVVFEAADDDCEADDDVDVR